MKRNRRAMELRVERRPNSREVLKPFKMLVDSWAVVEVRTGMVLRWMDEEKQAEEVIARVKAGGPV